MDVELLSAFFGYRNRPRPNGASDGCPDVAAQAIMAIADATRVAGTMYFSRRFMDASVAAQLG
ncbi:MAG: hypothetical protein U5O16_25270 [Rhodococcus sp. (in: high G+C Gram-positive bacteria)]|uniref:hypothetical protein n=1 Tax=Rhodococcus sp. TaxID=1831 RepID=UPI002AD68E0E|nr:hypothetical protein [Rhodococcus sp. (in: high G+C Gram-positive bacteria)]